jgi:methyltransferase (TIGR00027 family)
MMDLSQVSRTAILLLICRAVEAEKNPSEFNDPMAVLCFDRLMTIATEEEKRWMMQKKRMYAGIQEHDAKAGVRRGKSFDHIANRFIAEHPGCTVIDLASGFDTRFWRIDHEKCRYIELDLPEVIRLKKELLQDHLDHELIGTSVLNTSWIDQVTSDGNTSFLLLAEGLFMFLPQPDALKLLKEIGERFEQSQLVLDMVPEKWTRGLWKNILRLVVKFDWGLDDISWFFGMKDPHELENYGSGFKVIGVEKGSAGPILTISIHA